MYAEVFDSQVKDSETYQALLKTFWEKASGYTSVSVIVDPEQVPTGEVVAFLDRLNAHELPLIHHTFTEKLRVVELTLANPQHQHVIENLLATQAYETFSDSSHHVMPRSACLWLFDCELTKHKLDTLYKLGRVHGEGTRKLRFFRYWDPRVLVTLPYILSYEQQTQLEQVLGDCLYLNWLGELTWLDYAHKKVTQTELEATTGHFSFSQKQWQWLNHVATVNDVKRSIKRSYETPDDTFLPCMFNAIAHCHKFGYTSVQDIKLFLLKSVTVSKNFYQHDNVRHLLSQYAGKAPLKRTLARLNATDWQHIKDTLTTTSLTE